MNKITDVPQLQEIARQVRIDIIEMLFRAGSGHTGGSLSAVDILVALFFRQMRLKPDDPCWPRRDRFILSKGHGAPAYYAVLARLGYFPREELFTLRQFGSILQGHPDSSCTPGVEIPTGSLGQGLSIANGLALAAKLSGNGHRVYALLGDGEIQEGQIWEAAMSGSHYHLDNLMAVVDRNRLQIDGHTAEVMSLEPLADKWRAFGWHTLEVDGHDIKALLEAFQTCEAVKGRPSMIIAHTVKGKGVSIFENQKKYHGVTPTPEEYDLAMKELGGPAAPVSS
jgi:transketolase